MSTEQVRKGITNARFNEDNVGILNAEIILVSIAFGIFDKSWITFGASLFGLYCAVAWFPSLALIISVIFSCGWAAIGFFIGKFFISISASYVLAIIGFIAGLGCHLSAITWVSDISQE